VLPVWKKVQRKLLNSTTSLEVLNQRNIVTFSSRDRLDFSFLFLNVTDSKSIRAGRHFRSG
jgi:hypothetical protein